MRGLILLVVLCAVLAAGEAAKPAYEIIDWSASPKGQTGESTGELKHPVRTSGIMRYRLFAPAVLPEQPELGLVVAFHGLGSDENGVTGHARQALREIGADAGWVVAGGKSLGNGWAAADDTAVLQFIDWLQTVYPIDRRRIVVWGHSNGGWMSSWFASRHCDRIAGLVRWCGYGQDQPAAAGSFLEYYLVHGDADPTVKVDQSRNLRDQLRRDGHVVYREIHGGDHGSILGLPAVRQDAARWVQTLRHPGVAPPAEDVRLLRQLMAAKGDEAFTAPATWSDLIRIGGAAAWPVAVKAAKSKQATVRADLAKACAAVVFAGDETMAVLTRLADDDDADVRTAAIQALGVHANWRSQPAQVALVKLALNRKKAAEDRMAATGAIAAALVLPLLGNTADDPALGEGASLLLDTDPVELRSMIFAPLLAAVPGGLGYDPQSDVKARKASVLSWKGWFLERVGKLAKR